MKKTATLIAILFMSMVANAQSEKGTLTFYVDNFADNSGQAVVNLYNKQSGLPEKPLKQSSCKIVNGKATVTFEDLPYGDYAAILFHDENSNMTIDHKLFGPEPLGFSNGSKMSLEYKKLMFTFSMEKSVQNISIQKH